MLRNNGWAGHPTFTHVPYTKSNTDDDRVSRFVRAAGTYRHSMAEKDMGLEMILRDIAIMSDEYLLLRIDGGSVHSLLQKMRILL